MLQAHCKNRPLLSLSRKKWGAMIMDIARVCYFFELVVDFYFSFKECMYLKLVLFEL